MSKDLHTYVYTHGFLDRLIKFLEWRENQRPIPPRIDFSCLISILKSIRVNEDGELLTDGIPLHPEYNIQKIKLCRGELSEERKKSLREIGFEPVLEEKLNHGK